MSDGGRDDDEEEGDKSEDLQLGWKAVNRAMPVNVEALACIMAMVVMLMSMRLSLDREVDFYFPFLAIALKIINATINVTRTPMAPLRPTLSLSLSRPVMP